MNKEQHDYLLDHLHDIEDKIEATKNELKRFASFTGISVGSIASISSELSNLETEQRAICFTLRQLGYYVVYTNNHADKIIQI